MLAEAPLLEALFKPLGAYVWLCGPPLMLIHQTEFLAVYAVESVIIFFLAAMCSYGFRRDEPIPAIVGLIFLIAGWCLCGLGAVAPGI